MTSYNRENYIAEAIESVLSSSYNNFELLIVDDCSSDKTVQIVREYERKDSRICLIVNDKNLGQFQNRNKAIALSRGNFIKFLDSDDTIHRDGLEKMMQVLMDFPDAGMGVPSNLYDGGIPFELKPHESIMNHYRGGHHLACGPTGTIFRKEAIEKIGGFEEDFGILADTLLNIKVSCLYSVAFFSQNLHYWRIHTDQVTSEQKDEIRMIKERYRITNYVLQLSYLPISDEEKAFIRNNFYKINGRHFLKYFFNGRLKSAFLIKKNTELSLMKIIKAIYFNNLIKSRK